MIPPMPDQCAVCTRNLRPLDTGGLGQVVGLGCDAFPDGLGIPNEIQTDAFDHRQPHQGDHGLQFVAQPGQQHPKA